MGICVFVILAVLEIALAIRTCRRKPERKIWRRERLVVRAAESVIAVLCLVFAPQSWRFVPVLGFLLLLLVIAALTALIRRRKEDGPKKPGRAVTACVLCVLVCALLLLPAFLFTGYSGLPVSGEHEVAEAAAILVDGSRTDPFETDGSAREVPVHFYYPADGGAEKYPLVVFSHGAFGYYQSNTSTYMELASSGYVVAALDHPHHAFFTQDTAGGLVLVDTSFLNTAMNLGSADDPETEYKLYKEWMALRTADMNFAVDAIKEACGTGETGESWFFSGSGDAVRAALAAADPSRIGLMGHSMGGATSVELGRERDDIGAVIDLDGTMLGEYLGTENGEFVINEEPYDVPVLEFNNWDTYTGREEYLAQGGRYPNDELIRNASEGFSASVRGTEHMDFTDLPLFSPFLGKLLGSGERGTEECMTIVNAAVRSFFDCYLKGEGVFTIEEIL